MQIFKCCHCGLLLNFENRSCQGCGNMLGYDPSARQIRDVMQLDTGGWTSTSTPERFRFCANWEYDACNWLLPASSHERFCIACRHNRTVPALGDAENLANWRKMELAKHRLFYSLLRLNLPLATRTEQPSYGLAFDFLADVKEGKKVMTGHDNGIITLALKEADDGEREKRRTSMHEPYRTLLGHFRHEVGHYYWDRLIKDENRLDECRALFGDDTEDYGEALKQHYRQGPPPNWQDSYVSAYATTHAWEDFAETWSHYFHIVDSLDTANAFGLEVHPVVASDSHLHIASNVNSYEAEDFESLIELWLPLTYALNAMNRSMGLSDIYPFVLSPPVIEKLSFIHRVIHSPRKADSGNTAAYQG